MTFKAGDGTAAVPRLEWLSGPKVPTERAHCPNCGDPATKTAVFRALAGSERATFLRCADCGCGFVHPFWTCDYGATPSGGDAALAFYLQQGAGLSGITSNLATLPDPRGSSLLEVGCGFGFGLDFARRSLGWRVLGLDPSPFAARGRELLGLPIESRYLVADDPLTRESFDVVMASEVIEHVPFPPEFVRTLYGALKAGGTLVLTTPDVAAALPSTPPGLLVPLLSLGYHLVLQSAGSLERLLSGAGFVEVKVEVAGASLRARARRPGSPAPWAEASPNAQRGAYRRYVAALADACPPGSDLHLGALVRSYREAVNAAALPEAGRLWEAFSAACRRRYGREPEDGTTPPEGAPLEVLARSEPLCLGPALFHCALHRLLVGKPRDAVEALFVQAADACGRLRQALSRIGSDDADAEDIAWNARAETLLCEAERGGNEVPQRFARIGRAPSDGPGHTGGTGRTDEIRRRLYVSLCNAARLDEAGALQAAVTQVEALAGLPAAGLPDLPDSVLDVLFCAAAREMQIEDGSPEAALARLDLLDFASAAMRTRGRAGSALHLTAPGRDVRILALDVLGRKDEAEALRRDPAAA